MGAHAGGYADLIDVMEEWPNADTVHGHGLDSVVIEGCAEWLVVTPEVDDTHSRVYLLGIYPGEKWLTDEGDDATYVDLPFDADLVVKVLDAITEQHPEGTDRVAWMVQRVEDMVAEWQS